ncbi:MAG TPA: outer membrane lipoprotein chaperone LolA [Terriglobales bacterium]
MLIALVTGGIWWTNIRAWADSTPKVHEIAQAVDAHYDHLRTLKAQFTELYEGVGVERTESGTLWLKKPGKMRWEYRSPKEKLFLSDGKTAWFYVPSDRQARHTPVKNLDDLRSPLGLLLGKTKLEKELQGLSLAVDKTPMTPGDVVLRGVPKGLAGQVNDILLEVTPDHEIARIVLNQEDGSITEYRFQDQKENLEIEDKNFHFTPPAGVEVTEQELAE